ncbi:asl7035 (plasmid) [Nostoc sp. PCC 7120 = FACHB-418]|nr:asl7035 [Nostoc sp. PCC 7120 = FACHB-418]
MAIRFWLVEICIPLIGLQTLDCVLVQAVCVPYPLSINIKSYLAFVKLDFIFIT